jgi:hypothetical protein
MAKHDILLYNSTSSVFETNLSSNTARIKGDNSQLFSVISGSTELLKVDTTVSSVTLASSITASGNISGSLTSTASFAGLVRQVNFQVQHNFQLVVLLIVVLDLSEVYLVQVHPQVVLEIFL